MVNLDDTSTFSFPVFIDGGADQQFSYDGQYLLYRSEKNIDNNIYIMDLTTDSTFIISDGTLSTHAEWSNDGEKIIYSSSAEGNFDIVVLDLADTSENAQVTIANSKDAEIYGTFSPDDKMIAYASFDINYKGTLYVCDATGKNKRVISKGLGSSYNPKFSPGGTKIAFVSGTEKTTLYVCNTDGSGLKQLTGSGSTTEFDWSPDGKSIVFESKKEDVSSINIINLETGKSENLTGEKANNVTPTFQPIAK
jgi:Tol biopolymer transport system component